MNEVGLSIVLPALAAGLLVAATHVPLGIQVLARGIVFIDIAIAQTAGVGVVTADFLGFEPHGLAVQGWALGAGPQARGRKREAAVCRIRSFNSPTPPSSKVAFVCSTI